MTASLDPERRALRRERWRLLAQIMRYAEIPLFVLSALWLALIGVSYKFNRALLPKLIATVSNPWIILPSLRRVTPYEGAFTTALSRPSGPVRGTLPPGAASSGATAIPGICKLAPDGIVLVSRRHPACRGFRASPRRLSGFCPDHDRRAR